jgi:uncharacterized membrane protein YphA (DoxX/SURF4 family)
MLVASAIVAVVVAVLSAGSGAAKVADVKQLLMVRDRLGVPSRLWTFIGVLEIAAAAGLVVGIWVPALGVAAAAGLVLLTAGAIVVHARVRDPLQDLAPAAIALLLATTALTLRLLAL